MRMLGLLDPDMKVPCADGTRNLAICADAVASARAKSFNSPVRVLQLFQSLQLNFARLTDGRDYSESPNSSDCVSSRSAFAPSTPTLWPPWLVPFSAPGRPD
jgi:hypothetical protein